MAPFDRFQPPRGDESTAKYITDCACGCGNGIYEGYEHIDCDGQWFYDSECLFKYYKAEWRFAG